MLALVVMFALAANARAAGPAISVAIAHSPETFLRGDTGDAFTLTLTNTGDTATAGTITVNDTFTGGVRPRVVSPGFFECPSRSQLALGAPLTCTTSQSIAPGESLPLPVSMLVTTPLDAPDSVSSEVSVSGGGAPEATFGDPVAVLDRPKFLIQEFSARSLDEHGADDTLAGGHPFEASAFFSFPSYNVDQGQVDTPYPVQEAKDVFTDLPPGFVGNASAFPRCPLTGLQVEALFPNCPPASQIGTLELGIQGQAGQAFPLYNMIPEHGFPAELAFKVSTKAVVIYARLRPRTGGYGVTVFSPGISRVGITSIAVSLWGEPSLHNGAGGPPVPLPSNPVDCQQASPTATNIVDTWEHPAAELPGIDFGTPDLSDPLWKTATFTDPPVTGCADPALAGQFKPSIDVKPVQQTPETQADQPTGLRVSLDFPQSNDPTNPATVFDPSLPQAPELKDATVTLPEGLSISPSAAQGLTACSDQASDPAGDEVHYDSTAPVSCPDASKIGTVTATSPLLAAHDPATDAVTGAEPVNGSVFVVKPHPGDLGNRTYRLLIELESRRNGINVKLPGTAVADPTTGQLTTTFTENPQLPVKHLQLDLRSGPRAPLATPTTCGTFTTTSDMVPWSTPGTPDATPSSAFQVSTGPGGAPCPATPEQRPFAPQLIANNENAKAGAASPFVLQLTRDDGEQELTGVNVTMPPGFSARLAGIPYCSEQAIAAASGRSGGEEQASPSCPTASQVGSVSVAAGPGTNPYLENGRAYLAGPYKGAPLSLVFITPAVAGPFDLGNVVVRAAAFIDPSTTQVTVKTDAIPKILDGIPLRLRSVVARIDRPGFTINPTSCNSMAITGEASGASGATSQLSNHFQVEACEGLKFAPKFSATLTGQASKFNGAALTTKLSYPYAGNGAVNLTRVKVQLPKQLPSRLTTLQKACTAATFEANLAGCPPESVIGHATVNTPLLPVPLTGPAYFVSHGGEAFPSVELVLQGDGITVTLVGSTLIKGGITSTTFKTVPDVPFTTFELTLPQGKFSALGANLPAKANYNFCSQKMVMPTELVAQNGAAIHQNTKIATTGCKAPLTNAQKLAAALKACKKKHKGKRAACVRTARRQFGTAARRTRK
jgi:hypothetical protein